MDIFSHKKQTSKGNYYLVELVDFEPNILLHLLQVQNSYRKWIWIWNFEHNQNVHRTKSIKSRENK